MIKKTKEHLYDFLLKSDFDKSEIKYRYEHSLRVANIGLDLAVKEDANKKVAVIGCLLHDLGKFETEINRDHGRVSAKIARPFLETLDLSEKEINDICYAIATHVDGQAGYDYEPIIEASIVTDADNIDRFSSAKILQTKLWEQYDKDRSIEEQIDFYESRMDVFKKYKENNILETKSGNEVFQNKLDLNITFYTSLLEDLKITKEPVWSEK